MNLIEEFYSIREKLQDVIREKNLDDVVKVKIEEVFKKNKIIISQIKEADDFDEAILSHLFKMYELENKVKEL